MEVSTMASKVPWTSEATKAGKSSSSARLPARRPMASVAISRLAGVPLPPPEGPNGSGAGASCGGGSGAISFPKASRAKAWAAARGPPLTPHVLGGGGGVSRDRLRWPATAYAPSGADGGDGHRRRGLFLAVDPLRIAAVAEDGDFGDSDLV